MNAYSPQFQGCSDGVDLLSPPALHSGPRRNTLTLAQLPSKRVDTSPKSVESFSKARAGACCASHMASRMKAYARLAGLPLVPAEKQPVTISRAAQRLGFGERRTRAFWHGEARKVEAHEHEQARARMAPMVAQLVRNLETMRQMDAAFYGPQIDHIEQLLREAGYLVRTQGGENEVRPGRPE